MLGEVAANIEQASDTLKAGLGAVNAARKGAYTVEQAVYKVLGQLNSALGGGAVMGQELQGASDSVNKAAVLACEGMAGFEEVVGGASNHPAVAKVYALGGMAAKQQNGEVVDGDRQLPATLAAVVEDGSAICGHLEAARGLGVTVLEQIGLAHAILGIVEEAGSEAYYAMHAYVRQVT